MYCVPYFFIEIHFLLESDRKASEQVIKWPLLIGIEVQYHKCSQVRDCRRILRGRGDGGPKFSNLCICSWARRFFRLHMTLKNPEGGKEGPGPPISQPLPSSWIRYCMSGPCFICHLMWYMYLCNCQCISTYCIEPHGNGTAVLLFW